MQEKLIEMLRAYSKTPDVSLGSDLRMDLGLDSFQVVTLVVAIEDAFNVTIDNSKIADFITVRDILDYLQG